MRSSWAVTSTGVPTVDTTEKNDRTALPTANRTSITGAGAPTGTGAARSGRTSSRAAELGHEVGGPGVEDAADGLAPGPLQERDHDGGPVDDVLAHGSRLDEEAQHVGVGGHRVGCEQAAEEHPGAGVGPLQVPAAIHHHGGERLVLVEHPAQGPVDPRQRRAPQRLGRVERGEPGREQEVVALPQRRLQRPGRRPPCRLGCARPVSTKLTYRGVVPASIARASWLAPRRPRHWRSREPNGDEALRAGCISPEATTGGPPQRFPPWESPACPRRPVVVACSSRSSPPRPPPPTAGPSSTASPPTSAWCPTFPPYLQDR